MLRSACGSQDHPDPKIFIQIFRLLGVYSLVKPPRGGNITGGELLQPLSKTTLDLKNSKKKTDKDWLSKLDAMIENGFIEGDNDDMDLNDESVVILTEEFQEHNYDVVETTHEVKAYMAGYVAFKMQRFSSCANCSKTMIEQDPEELKNNKYYDFIKMIDKVFVTLAKFFSI